MNAFRRLNRQKYNILLFSFLMMINIILFCSSQTEMRLDAEFCLAGYFSAWQACTAAALPSQTAFIEREKEEIQFLIFQIFFHLPILCSPLTLRYFNIRNIDTQIQ